MRNPLAYNSQYKLAYWLVWALLGGFYASMLVFLWQFSWQQALVDALMFSSLFAVMGIAVWFVVNFSGLDSVRIFNTIMSHLVAGALLVFIVVAVAEGVLSTLFSREQNFYNSQSEFHLYRLIIGGIIYIFLAFNFYLIFYYEEYRSRKLREAEINQSLKSAELSMLKAQINPHFIFNSLNSVSSLTLTNPAKAHEMVLQLADFLRYSIRENTDQLVSLQKEVEAIKLFLAIEKTRYGNRLQVEIKCNENTYNATLPALILQPLVENAIKYSLHESDDESHIIINCTQDEGLLHVVIRNNYLPKLAAPKGAGIGLNNVKARLSLVYNRNDLLGINQHGNTFEVNINFPQV